MTACKSGPLERSQSYIWNRSDVIGRGATSTVFFGRNVKNMSEIVAVKVFNLDVRYDGNKFREMQHVRQLNHENVLKFLGIECIQDDKGQMFVNKQVIIMEYAPEGSAYNLLHNPENGYGFEPTEFCRFQYDLAKGLEYLRKSEIIHRDIKPGNIMKITTDDGKSVYKLADFGAARKLSYDDGEQFMSLYGTEEYLQPDVHRVAVLRDRSGRQTFDSSVDLWSLGATLYHVATGRVPFEPLEGARKNSQVMQAMTSGKGKDDIAAMERADGVVVYQKELPETCRLTGDLREEVVLILRKLLKYPKSELTTQQYFERVDAFYKKQVFNLFFTDKTSAKFLSIYLDPTETISGLRRHVSKLLKMPDESLLFIFKGKDLSFYVSESKRVAEYPEVLKNGQIIVCDTGDSSEVFNVESVYSKQVFSELKEKLFRQFEEMIDQSNSKTIRSSVGEKKVAAQRLVWEVSQFHSIEDFLLETHTQLSNFLSSKISEVYQRCLSLKIDFLKVEKEYSKLEVQDKKIKDQLARIDNLLEQADVYTKELLAVNQKKNREFKELPCNHADDCTARVEQSRKNIFELCDGLLKLLKYYAEGELHTHETKVYQARRASLVEEGPAMMRKIDSCKDHFIGNVKELVSKLSEEATHTVARYKKVIANLDKLEKELASLKSGSCVVGEAPNAAVASLNLDSFVIR